MRTTGNGRMTRRERAVSCRISPCVVHRGAGDGVERRDGRRFGVGVGLTVGTGVGTGVGDRRRRADAGRPAR